jgi:hypothetical protein
LAATVAMPAIASILPLLGSGQQVHQIVEVALLLGAGRRIFAAHHAHQTHVVGAIAQNLQRLHQARQAIAFDVQLLFQLGGRPQRAFVDDRLGRHLGRGGLGGRLFGAGTVRRRSFGRRSFGRRRLDPRIFGAGQSRVRRRLGRGCRVRGRVGSRCLVGRRRSVASCLGRRRVARELGRRRVGDRLDSRLRYRLNGRRGAVHAPYRRRLAKNNPWELGNSFHRLFAARALRRAGLTSFSRPLRAS